MEKNFHSIKDNSYISSLNKKDKSFNNTIHFRPFTYNNIKIKKHFSSDVGGSIDRVLNELQYQKKVLTEQQNKKIDESTFDKEQKEEIKLFLREYGKSLTEFENNYKNVKGIKVDEFYITGKLDPKIKEYTKEINRLHMIIPNLNYIIKTIDNNPFTQPNSFKKFIEGLPNLPQTTKDNLNNLGNTQYSQEETNKAQKSIENDFSSEIQKIEDDLNNLNQSKLEEESKLKSEKDPGKIVVIEESKKKLDKQIEEKNNTLKEIKEKMITLQIKKNRMQAFRKDLESYRSFCSEKKIILENLLLHSNQLIMIVNPTIKTSDRDTTSKSTDPSSWNWTKIGVISGSIIAIIGLWNWYLDFEQKERVEEERKRNELEKNPQTHINRLAEAIVGGNAITKEEISKYLDQIITSNDEKQKFTYLSYDTPSIKILYGSSGTGKTESLKRKLRERGKNVMYLSLRAGNQAEKLLSSEKFNAKMIEALNKYLPFKIPGNMDANSILINALGKLATDCEHEWSKENPIPVIVIDDIHSWAYKKENKWYFDISVASMLGDIVELILSNKAIIIFGVSEMETLDAFNSISGFDGRHEKVRYEKIDDETFETALKESHKIKDIFGSNTVSASKKITELLGSDFSTFHDLMGKLSNLNLKEKSEQELENQIINTVNELSKYKNKLESVLNDGLVNSSKQITDRNKCEAALMTDLIFRCVSNHNNTKHLPFKNIILDEFEKGFSLFCSYGDSIDYLSEMNLIHSIDVQTADLHKRILLQTWKQWSQNERNLIRLRESRKKITIFEKDKTGKEIEKPIFPTLEEIEYICSQFYSKHSN